MFGVSHFCLGLITRGSVWNFPCVQYVSIKKLQKLEHMRFQSCVLAMPSFCFVLLVIQGMIDRLHFILKHILTSHFEWFRRRIPLPVGKAVWNSYALYDNALAAKTNKQQKPTMSWTTVKPYQRLLSILTFLVTLTFHDCQDHHIHQISQKSSSVFHWINMKFLTGIELFKFSYLQVSTKRKALCT